MNTAPNPRLTHTLDIVTRALVAELEPGGHWTGRLSPSALATATAVTALATADPHTHAPLIHRGLQWLAQHANTDGGWGDTTRSRSNLSTTALAWAAFGATQADAHYPHTTQHAQRWLAQHAGPLEDLIPTLEAAYGRDRTFSVPITMMLALSGRLGPNGWQRVRPLPFELGALPPRLFGALRLPVVSYALPALIAIGQVSHHFNPSSNPLSRMLRHLARQPTLDLLTAIQPPNGGFLEATPLTSFVVMSLAAMGLAHHPVAQRGTDFLARSARADGSWPIDTNLATWVTTLSVKALAHQPATLSALPIPRLQRWLLDQQHLARHPYTQAKPGGWAWTPLPGGVPDADDTAGTLLALHLLDASALHTPTRDAAHAGIRWLLDLQNHDGGIPTFCRGWGTLPFDRSAPELTAHALRAWNAWLPHLAPPLQRRLLRAVPRAYTFLARSQQADGSWLPLWFGNEHAPASTNPVYGTAHVLLCLRLDPPNLQTPPEALAHGGRRYLLEAQNPDGGWGGANGTPSSIEETSLALEALFLHDAPRVPITRALEWLMNAIELNQHQTPTPIGLYFARLWYHERLYPLSFAAAALALAQRKHQRRPSPHQQPPT